MNDVTAPPSGALRKSWLPMVIIAMGQAQMSLNINALPVSIGGIVGDFDVPATTVGTAIVVHSLAVAGFTMLGAKLGQKFRSLAMFRVGTIGLLAEQVDFDRTNFISNARLKDVLTATSATPEQVDEAVRINAGARLRALKLSFLLLAGIALLMISPVGRLPNYVRGAAVRQPERGP